MKSDIQIQQDVMDQLKWEPLLAASEIGVSVKNGIVTLSGIVDTFSKKLTAEKAAKSIAGVKVVAEDIQVGISPLFRRSDAEVAQAVLNALGWHTGVQHETIKIKVEDGTVMLEGEVEWEFQKVSARTAIENLAGVKHIINMIVVKPKVVATDIEKEINAAFHRSATIDAHKVTAVVSGTKVTLKGKVKSFAEKADAERAAWAAPGVTAVESKLEVGMPQYEYIV